MSVSSRTGRGTRFKIFSLLIALIFIFDQMTFAVEVLDPETGTYDLQIPSRFGDADIPGEPVENAELARMLQNEASLVYVSRLMEKILAGWGTIMSPDAVKTILRDHLAFAKDHNIKWRYVEKQGKTFTLPYVRDNGREAVLRFYLSADTPEEAEGKKAIDVGDGKVCIVIEGPDGREYDEDRTPLQKTAVGARRDRGSAETQIMPALRTDQSGRAVPGRKRGSDDIKDAYSDMSTAETQRMPAVTGPLEDGVKDDPTPAMGITLPPAVNSVEYPNLKLAPVQEGKVLVDTVLEGGGAKGVAYGGALDVVAEKGMWFRRVAGTSAGAITASLIAAGYDHKEIRGIIYETDFNDFKDWRWGIVPPWLNLLAWGGMYRGLFFEKWIAGKFKERLGYEPTLKDMPIPLTVIASDISDSEMLILNAETAPDLKVSEAVRMSMGIPFFFNVHSWFGSYKSKIKKRRVVDGGLLSNFPIFVMENDGEHGVPVIGFMLRELPDRESPKTFWSRAFALLKKVPVVHILLEVLETGMDAHDKRHIEDDTWARIVDIPVDVGTTDFDLTREQKTELMDRGRDATEKALAKALGNAVQIDRERSERISKEKVKGAAAAAEVPAAEALSEESNNDPGDAKDLSRRTTRIIGTEKDPGDEIVQMFIDKIVIMAVEADMNGQSVILGIDTGFIPDMQMQTTAMTNLLKALRQMNLKNVVVCQGEGVELYDDITAEREKADVPKKNIVVIGEKEVLSMEVFDGLESVDDEMGAYFAEVVVPDGFPDNGDVTLIRIATMALSEAGKYVKTSRRREFILDAEPLGIDKLVEKLERQTERISA